MQDLHTEGYETFTETEAYINGETPCTHRWEDLRVSVTPSALPATLMRVTG